MKKAVFTVIIILLLVIFGLTGWKTFTIWQEYQAGEKAYAALDQFVSVPETAPTPATQEAQKPDETQPASEATEPTAPQEVWPQVDFVQLQQINPDVVGWIYIEGTKVNYPIVQGKDNDYYLYRLVTGEHNSSGSIFLEAGLPRDFSAQNNPIYGHHMKNGTMFENMTHYKKQSYYDEHPVALLMTPEKNYKVRLFSGYVIKASGDAWDTQFSQEDFAKWLERIKGRSLFQCDVVPTAEDRILTFSTCTYENDNARFVVHGVIEE